MESSIAEETLGFPPLHLGPRAPRVGLLGKAAVWDVMSHQTKEAGTSRVLSPGLCWDRLASKLKVNEKACTPLERDPPLACRAGCFHRSLNLPVTSNREAVPGTSWQPWLPA